MSDEGMAELRRVYPWAADEIKRLRDAARRWENECQHYMHLAEKRRAALERIANWQSGDVSALVIARDALAGTAETGSVVPGLIENLDALTLAWARNEIKSGRAMVEVTSLVEQAKHDARAVAPADVAPGEPIGTCDFCDRQSPASNLTMLERRLVCRECNPDVPPRVAVQPPAARCSECGGVVCRCAELDALARDAGTTSAVPADCPHPSLCREQGCQMVCDQGGPGR